MPDIIVIRIPKNASKALVKVLPAPANIHETPARIIKRIGLEKWNSTFTVAFTRHPLDRLMSWYSYHAGKYIKTDWITWLQQGMPVHDRWASGQFDYPLCQLAWIDRVRFVGRVETLAKDFIRLQKEYGHPLKTPPVINVSRDRGLRWTPQALRLLPPWVFTECTVLGYDPNKPSKGR